MRRLLLLLLLSFPFSSYTQLSREKLLSEALSQLQIPQENIFSKEVSFRSFGPEALIVFPVIAEKEEGIAVFDACLVLVDSHSGKILSKYSGNKDWYSDAVMLSRINIDSTAYKLNGSGLSYGIILEYYNNSRVFPYNSTELTLFHREGEQLKPVLRDFRIAYMNGETDTHCNGSFEFHSKTLEVTAIENEGFYNLKFTDSIRKAVSTFENCDLTLVEESREVEILKFEDGTYKKPL